MPGPSLPWWTVAVVVAVGGCGDRRGREPGKGAQPLRGVLRSDSLLASLPLCLFLGFSLSLSLFCLSLFVCLSLCPSLPVSCPPFPYLPLFMYLFVSLSLCMSAPPSTPLRGRSCRRRSWRWLEKRRRRAEVSAAAARGRGNPSLTAANRSKHQETTNRQFEGYPSSPQVL